MSEYEFVLTFKAKDYKEADKIYDWLEDHEQKIIRQAKHDIQRPGARG